MKKPTQKAIEAGTKNLIPLNKRSPEEKAAILEKAAAGRSLAAKKRKTINQIAAAILKMNGNDLLKSIDDPALKEQFEKLDLSIYDITFLKMIDETLKGNTKAFELIRDSAGDKPTTKTETDINVRTENDDRLLKKIADRLNIDTDEYIDVSFKDV